MGIALGTGLAGAPAVSSQTVGESGSEQGFGNINRFGDLKGAVATPPEDVDTTAKAETYAKAVNSFVR